MLVWFSICHGMLNLVMAIIINGISWKLLIVAVLSVILMKGANDFVTPEWTWRNICNVVIVSFLLAAWTSVMFEEISLTCPFSFAHVAVAAGSIFGAMIGYHDAVDARDTLNKRLGQKVWRLHENTWVDIEPIKKPIKVHTLGATNMSEIRAHPFNNNFDNCIAIV